MLVDQVKGIPGELGTTTGVALNQVGVLVACSEEIGRELEFVFQNQKDARWSIVGIGGSNIRVICQTRSLEMFVTIVMRVLEFAKIDIAV